MMTNLTQEEARGSFLEEEFFMEDLSHLFSEIWIFLSKLDVVVGGVDEEILDLGFIFCFLSPQLFRNICSHRLSWTLGDTDSFLTGLTLGEEAWEGNGWKEFKVGDTCFALNICCNSGHLEILLSLEQGDLLICRREVDDVPTEPGIPELLESCWHSRCLEMEGLDLDPRQDFPRHVFPLQHRTHVDFLFSILLRLGRKFSPFLCLQRFVISWTMVSTGLQSDEGLSGAVLSLPKIKSFTLRGNFCRR